MFGVVHVPTDKDMIEEQAAPVGEHNGAQPVPEASREVYADVAASWRRGLDICRGYRFAACSGAASMRRFLADKKKRCDEAMASYNSH